MKLNTPAELFSKLVEKQEDLVYRVVSEIASALSSKFLGKPIEVWLPNSLQELRVVESIVQAQLLNKGWSFEISKEKEGRYNERYTCVIVSSLNNLTNTKSTEPSKKVYDYTDDLCDVNER